MLINRGLIALNMELLHGEGLEGADKSGVEVLLTQKNLQDVCLSERKEVAEQ